MGERTGAVRLSTGPAALGVLALAAAFVTAGLFGFGVTNWYDRKGLHRVPAESEPEKTSAPA